MTEAMDYRGPDGISHWTDRRAALGHCMLRTTAESLEEVQPLADESGNLHLVMDGWLANPEELRADLLARGTRLRDRSDAELVLRRASLDVVFAAGVVAEAFEVGEDVFDGHGESV